MKAIWKTLGTVFAALTLLVVLVLFAPLRAIAGLESPCTYISDLVATNPLSSDLASTSDDHLRCIKLAVKDSFPNVNGAVSATDEQLSTLSTGNPTLSAAAPLLDFDETDAGSNERSWLFSSAAGIFRLSTATDAAPTTVVTNAIALDRTGTTVDSIALTSTALTWNGNTLFTTANDGSGSGLDADLLDGSHLSALAVLANSNTFTGQKQVFSNAVPALQFTETDASANNGVWDCFPNGETFNCRVVNDALSSASNWLSIDRTTTTVDSVNLQGTAIQTNGTDITCSTGSFTGTLTGYGSNPTGTVNYEKCHGEVTLYISSAITGTSNANTLTMTGLAAAVQPTIAVEVLTMGQTSGVVTLANATIAASGSTITFNMASAALATISFGNNWATSGTKGLSAGWQIHYKL